MIFCFKHNLMGFLGFPFDFILLLGQDEYYKVFIFPEFLLIHGLRGIKKIKNLCHLTGRSHLLTGGWRNTTLMLLIIMLIHIILLCCQTIRCPVKLNATKLNIILHNTLKKTFYLKSTIQILTCATKDKLGFTSFQLYFPLGSKVCLLYCM